MIFRANNLDLTRSNIRIAGDIQATFLISNMHTKQKRRNPQKIYWYSDQSNRRFRNKRIQNNRFRRSFQIYWCSLLCN